MRFCKNGEGSILNTKIHFVFFSMPLRLLPLEEHDLAAYHQIAWQGFQEDGLSRLMYPNGFSQTALDSSVDWDRAQWHKRGDKIKLLKVIDTTLAEDDPYNKIVGISEWKIYPKPRTEEEMEEERRQDAEEPMTPGIFVPLVEEFSRIIGRLRKERMGHQAYILLDFLATLPQHRRRGIGAMHLQWGSKKADELGLPLYLESSAMGRPLYERMGFEFVGHIPFDARKWGSSEDLPLICMKRPPRTSSKNVK